MWRLGDLVLRVPAGAKVVKVLVREQVAVMDQDPVGEVGVLFFYFQIEYLVCGRYAFRTLELTFGAV